MTLGERQVRSILDTSLERFRKPNFHPESEWDDSMRSRLASVAEAAGASILHAATGMHDVKMLRAAPALLMFNLLPSGHGLLCTPWLRHPDSASEGKLRHAEVAQEYAAALGVGVAEIHGNPAIPYPDTIVSFGVSGSNGCVAVFGEHYGALSDQHEQALNDLARATPNVSYLVTNPEGLKVAAIATAPLS